MIGATVEPNTVDCTAPWCQAAPFHPCTDYRGRPMGRFHSERRTAAASTTTHHN